VHLLAVVVAAWAGEILCVWDTQISSYIGTDPVRNTLMRHIGLVDFVGTRAGNILIRVLNHWLNTEGKLRHLVVLIVNIIGVLEVEISPNVILTGSRVGIRQFIPTFSITDFSTRLTFVGPGWVVVIGADCLRSTHPTCFVLSNVFFNLEGGD